MPNSANALFVINCNQSSYLVSYNTPEDGVILYYVEELPYNEPAASFSYNSAAISNEKKTHMAIAGGGALIGGAFLGGGSFDPLLQTCYAY